MGTKENNANISNIINTLEGFPTKHKSHLAAILESLTNGATITEACKAAGIERSTLWRWQQKYPSVREAVEFALQARIEIVEDALFKKAAMGHVTAMIFWLCNRAPDRWRNVQKIEHSGKVEGEITHDLSVLRILAKKRGDGKTYGEVIRDVLREAVGEIGGQE